MDKYAGAELLDYIESIGATRYQKRDCFDEMTAYLNDDDERICALYGLRRTGKTVLMLQAAAEDPNDSLYATFYPDDTMEDLKRMLNDESCPRNVYLDEVTNIPGFSRLASVLPIKYVAKEKKRIVIAGTDSYALAIAGMDGLYEKCKFIHTTYMPYKEYHRLTGHDLDGYIRHGGILAERVNLSDKEQSDRYFRSAILRNIERSLEGAGRDGEFGALRPFYERGEFSTFIKKIVELSNRSFLARTVNRRFKSHDFGSLKELMDKNPDMTDEDFSFLTSEEIRQRLLKALDIKEPLLSYASEEAMEQARDYLEWADVIYRVPKSEDVIFIQPGIRYSQLEAEKEVLEDIDIPEDTDGNLRAMLKKKLESDIVGQLLEDIVYFQLAKDKAICKDFNVRKFNGVTKETGGLRGREVDICLLSKKGRDSYWIEVKNSSEAADGQLVHLKSPSFQDLYREKTGQDVVGEILLYRGKSFKQAEGVLYCNAAEFLCSPREFLEKARDWLRECGRG